jgi:hypothetical protein
MPKNLPHLSGIRQWIYTAYSVHYQWETVVRAPTIQQARVAGYREAKTIMGNHASITRDEVREL